MRARQETDRNTLLPPADCDKLSRASTLRTSVLSSRRQSKCGREGTAESRPDCGGGLTAMSGGAEPQKLERYLSAGSLRSSAMREMQ